MRSTDCPATRELVQRLLTYEAVAQAPDAETVYRVCDTLRRRLTTLNGAASFRSLLGGAMALTKQECPVLGAFEVKADGSLDGLSEDTAGLGTVVIAHLVGLRLHSSANSITLRVLHDVWTDLPGLQLRCEEDGSK